LPGKVDDGESGHKPTEDARFIRLLPSSRGAPRFLDSAVYQPGRLIAIIGEIGGNKIRPIDEIMYRYPLLDEKFVYLRRPSAVPRFFFGIEVSGSV